MGDNYPSDTTNIHNHGVRGVISTGAGLGLMLFNSLLNLPVIGWVIGGGLVVIGVMGVTGKSRTDKVSGALFIGAGALGLGSFLLPGLTSFLLGLPAIGLLGYGIFNLVKFARGIKSRG